MSQLSEVRKLLKYLPNEDIEIGTKLLNERELESLQDLVRSAIVRAKRGKHKDPPDERYVNVSIDGLMELKIQLHDYISMIYPPDDDYTTYDDLEIY